MEICSKKLTKADVLISVGLIVGVMDWISDIIYLAVVEFEEASLNTAGVTFVLIQPVFYAFIFVVYILSHQEIENP